MLDVALQQVENDPEAWEAKGIVLVRANRLREAAAAFSRSLDLQPRRESALTNAAYLAQRMDRTADAIDYWKRAVRVNPYRPAYHANLAALFSGERRWQEGKEHVDRWVELEPGNVDARRARVLYLMRLNDRETARKEFAVIEALKPGNLAELKVWWDAENR
jgi:Flp pilus assembly protein TadD